MPRFAANLSTLYPEYPFPDRFQAARKDGFEYVECQFPYDHPADLLAERLRASGLRQVLINAPAGHWAQGERGLTALPDRVDEFRHGFEARALPYAHALGCSLIHVMAGIVPAGANPEPFKVTYLENLAWAAALAASNGIRILIEPLNPFDVPGYLLHLQDQAHKVVTTINSPHLGIQLDLYHCQRTEGNVLERLPDDLSSGLVHHVQMASVPLRREPDEGDLPCETVFRMLDDLAYPGHVGCEYHPRAGTSEGLAWFRNWRSRPA